MDDDSRVLIRLNSLMKAGYKINEDSSQEVTDAIWLKHPASGRAQEPELILYGDGRLVSVVTKESHLDITSDQDNEFSLFVNDVPRPSAWEKIESFRIGLVAWIVILSFGALIVTSVKYVITLFS